MYSVQSMRRFVCDRLTAAAQEILGAFENKIEGYEAEIARQRRLLDAVLTPEIKLHRTGLEKYVQMQQFCVKQPNVSDYSHCMFS